MSSFTGSDRKLVAVGTCSEMSMFFAVRAGAPRNTVRTGSSTFTFGRSAGFGGSAGTLPRPPGLIGRDSLLGSGFSTVGVRRLVGAWAVEVCAGFESDRPVPDGPVPDGPEPARAELDGAEPDGAGAEVGTGAWAGEGAGPALAALAVVADGGPDEAGVRVADPLLARPLSPFPARADPALADPALADPAL